jgi:hypothetical protein
MSRLMESVALSAEKESARAPACKAVSFLQREAAT